MTWSLRDVGRNVKKKKEKKNETELKIKEKEGSPTNDVSSHGDKETRRPSQRVCHNIFFSFVDCSEKAKALPGWRRRLSRWVACHGAFIKQKYKTKDNRPRWIASSILFTVVLIVNHLSESNRK